MSQDALDGSKHTPVGSGVAGRNRHAHVDARIGLLGDTHADYRWTTLAIRNLHRKGIRQVHVLGDFGFLSNGNPYERRRLRLLSEQLISRNMFLYVTEGNHEGFPILHKHYPRDQSGYRYVARRIVWLPRGWRGTTVAGTVIASLGGANSINRGNRDPRVHGQIAAWHPEEQITESDLAALGREHVDILLGHDAPISTALARRVAQNRRLWDADGIAYAAAGQAMFHHGVERVRPRLVVSGHYHRYLDTTVAFHPEAETGFTARSVILGRNRSPRSVAVLQVDTATLDSTPSLSPGRLR